MNVLVLFFSTSSSYATSLIILKGDDDSLSDASSIEDLGANGDLPELETLKGENRDLNTGWSKAGGNSEIMKRALAKNLIVENERLGKTGRIVKYIHDDADNNECEGERKQSTVMTAGEVLVRQDAFQMTRDRGKTTPHRVPRRNRGEISTSLFEADSQADKFGAKISTIHKVAPMTQSEHMPSNLNENKPLSNGLAIKTAKIITLSTEQATYCLFMGSSIVLSSTDQKDIQRSIAVATPLASKMKSHQVDAITFMWEKVCSDLALATSYEEVVEERLVGGAILAHFMGLGKTAGKENKHCVSVV